MNPRNPSERHPPLRAAVALIVVVVVAALALGYRATRRSAQQRFADLSACLLGGPLDPGETPSQRIHAIEYVRPPRKAKLDATAQRLVPVDPIPPDKDWPTRCDSYADAFAHSVALRWLAPRAIPAAGELEDELQPHVEMGGVEFAPHYRLDSIDELWRAAKPLANPNVAPDANVVRPWAAAILTPRNHQGGLDKTCPIFALDAPIDRFERDSILLSDKPSCSVVAGTDAAPLARLLRAAPPGPRTNLDAGQAQGKATVLGWTLNLQDGQAKAQSPDGSSTVDLGAADRMVTCNAGSTRVVLLQAKEPESFDVRFIDEHGISPAARVPLKAPPFPGHGETKVSHGALELNCREHEARVGWAWSTAVDQAHQHVIRVADCSPGRCQIRETHASIPMSMYSGCGYCSPDPNPYAIDSPTVIDLFDAVALIWSAHVTERARIAPLDRLNEARDIVFWEKPEGCYDEFQKVRARGPVVLVGVSVTQPDERRLFRIDAHGVTALSPE